MNPSSPGNDAPPAERRAGAIPPPGPGDDQLVLSWIGWGIEDLWLREEEEYEAWYRRLDAIVAARGWRYLRRRNPIDFIVERPARSIGRRDVFAFQREFADLNELFGLRLSGAIYLMTKGDSALNPESPWEQYHKGQIIWGDSAGRPERHRIRKKNLPGQF